MELEVIWSGSDKDTYLCIPPPGVRDLSHIQPLTVHTSASKRLYRSRTDRSALRFEIRRILQMRGTMHVADLRKKVTTKDPQFYNVLTRMVQHGMLDSPERGIVRLALSRRAEERA